MGGAYWLVVSVAGVFTLARRSEAFLLLRAQSVGVLLAVVPLVLDHERRLFVRLANGARSDRLGRYNLLAVDLPPLVAADLVLAFANGTPCLASGVRGVCTWTHPACQPRRRPRPGATRHRFGCSTLSRDCDIAGERYWRAVGRSVRLDLSRAVFTPALIAPGNGRLVTPTNPIGCSPAAMRTWARRARRRRRGFHTSKFS